MPSCFELCFLRARLLYAQKTSTSFFRSAATLCTRRDSSGRRRRESRITRSNGRRRGRPLRSVSSGIVGENRSDSDQQRVVLVAEFLHVGAGDFAGDPAAGENRLGGTCVASDLGGRRSDLAVERHGGFQRHQRHAVADVAGEGFVQAASLFFQAADFDLHAGGAQFFESLSADFRIGVGHGRDHAMNSGGDEGVGAGRSAALMGVRFEVDVESGAARFCRRRLPGREFRRASRRVGVGSGADDVAVRVGDNGADVGIGRGQADALARQFQGAVESCSSAE